MKKIIKISYLQTIVKTAEEMKQLAKLLNIKGSLDELFLCIPAYISARTILYHYFH